MTFFFFLLVALICVGAFFVFNKKARNKVEQRFEDIKEKVEDKFDDVVEKVHPSPPPLPPSITVSENVVTTKVPEVQIVTYVTPPEPVKQPSAPIIPSIEGFVWRKFRFFAPISDPDELLFNWIADNVHPDVAFAWAFQRGSHASFHNNLTASLSRAYGNNIGNMLVALYQPGNMEPSSPQWQQLGMPDATEWRNGGKAPWYSPQLSNDLKFSSDAMTLYWKEKEYKLPSPAFKPFVWGQKN
jgi:hypothetical protein